MKYSERSGQADGYVGYQGPNTLAAPKKLLVIDDEAGICTVIARMATALGLCTRVAPEPLEAVADFLDFAPDAVLLDMIMPGKDGIDLLHEMLLTGVPAKFVLMSGYGDTYMRLAKGVTAFHGVEPPAMLSKPFRRGALVALLRATLSIDPMSST
ncbi:MAG TPA: response regulator [Acetobacteraceae bacterium]|jgi:CheY-like chemotaxis protein